VKELSVGIIGCGLIGKKRAQALGEGGKLIACADIDFAKAQSFAADYGAHAFKDWRELIHLPEIEVIFISTLHDSLALITHEALAANKHILVEKPAARISAELKPILALQKNSKSSLIFHGIPFSLPIVPTSSHANIMSKYMMF
jgi:predicted dehydrogenase